ncbi:MAG: SpaA isopeptide-forming pilin-related protein [Halovenus sp.]|uniref:SpaA isopeptide-forming pilin-related protein n=1 Tax=Halovenus amylolytica TaxID=2500550 RepID=UPI000FE2CDAD
MKRLGATVVVVVLVVGLTIGAVGTVSAQQQTTMTVSVTDGDGNPISDAEVTASWGDGDGTATTRSNGNALIDVPTDADIEVSVEHPEYVQNIPKTVDDPDNTVSIEMLEPGAAEITVVDEENGEPVEDVQLTLTHTNVGKHDDGAEVATIETDGNGVAEIAEIEQREYTVETNRPGYLINETTLDLDGNDVTEQIEIESRNVEIEFNITDNYLDSPVEGAAITVDGSSAGTTTSDGTQVTRLAVNDNYDITVAKEGYTEKTRELQVGEQPAGFELTIRRTPEISIEPLQTAVVAGQQTQVTITNAYGDPVPEASVSLNGEGVAQTNSQGSATFTVSDAGENTISVEYRGLEDSISIEGVEQTADNETEDGSTDSVGTGFGIAVAVLVIAGLTIALSRRQTS